MGNEAYIEWIRPAHPSITNPKRLAFPPSLPSLFFLPGLIWPLRDSKPSLVLGLDRRWLGASFLADWALAKTLSISYPSRLFCFLHTWPVMGRSWPLGNSKPSPVLGRFRLPQELSHRGTAKAKCSRCGKSQSSRNSKMLVIALARAKSSNHGKSQVIARRQEPVIVRRQEPVIAPQRPLNVRLQFYSRLLAFISQRTKRNYHRTTLHPAIL